MMVGGELAIPGIASLVNIEVPEEVARALHDIRNLESQLRDAKRDLVSILETHATNRGTRTMHLAGVDVVLTSKRDVVWDIEALESKLRRAGLPEERLNELIKETVSRSVNANVAKSVAGANPKYARIIKACRSETEGSTSATVTVL